MILSNGSKMQELFINHSQHRATRNKESLALAITCNLFIGVSILFMLASIISFLISYKHFFKVRANILYFNYALSITLGLIALPVIQHAPEDVGCIPFIIISILLQYSWTGVFCWSLSMSILIFHALWLLGVTKPNRIYQWLGVSGWFLPIIFCIPSIVITGLSCGNNDTTIIRSFYPNHENKLIYTFLFPLPFILTVNAIVWIASLLKIRFALKKYSDATLSNRIIINKLISSGIVLATILCIPCLSIFIICLPLSIISSAFKTVFSFCNALIGYLFFILICLQNEEVRMRFSDIKNKLLKKTPNKGEQRIRNLSNIDRKRNLSNIDRRNDSIKNNGIMQELETTHETHIKENDIYINKHMLDNICEVNINNKEQQDNQTRIESHKRKISENNVLRGVKTLVSDDIAFANRSRRHSEPDIFVHIQKTNDIGKTLKVPSSEVDDKDKNSNNRLKKLSRNLSNRLKPANIEIAAMFESTTTQEIQENQIFSGQLKIIDDIRKKFLLALVTEAEP